MKALLARLAHDALAPIEQAARDAVIPIGHLGARLLVRAELFLLAFGCLSVAGVFLAIALYMAIEPWAGTQYAVLVVGGLYLCVAVAFIVAAMVLKLPFEPTRTTATGPAVTGEAVRLAAKPETEERVEALHENPDFARAIDQAAAPLLDLLRETGLDRERLGLIAGVACAKQLRPMTLVGIVFAVGIAAGHLWRRQYK